MYIVIKIKKYKKIYIRSNVCSIRFENKFLSIAYVTVCIIKLNFILSKYYIIYIIYIMSNVYNTQSPLLVSSIFFSFLLFKPPSAMLFITQEYIYTTHRGIILEHKRIYKVVIFINFLLCWLLFKNSNHFI